MHEVLLVEWKLPPLCFLVFVSVLGSFAFPGSVSHPSSLLFLWRSLAFINPEDGLCWCVRASRLCGTNASVSLRRNREITVLLLLGCSTWPLEDNGQLRRRLWESWSKTVLVSCWIGPWSGNEEDDEQWFKTVPFVSLEMAIGPWTYDI